MKNKLWKKGDKVVRLYGSNSWNRPGSMVAGDIGTVLKNQKHPGTVHLLEYHDIIGHDVIRLRRLKDYPHFTSKELCDLWKLTDGRYFEEIIKFIELKFKNGK